MHRERERFLSLLSRLTGEFRDSSEERIFRLDTLVETVRISRLAILTGSIFYFLFTFVDLYTQGWCESFAVRGGARLAVLVAGFAIWLMMQDAVRLTLLDRSCMVFSAVLFASFWTVTATKPPMLFTNVSMFVTLGAIYLAAPVPFVSIALIGAVASAGYWWVAVTLVHDTGDSPLALGLLLLFANVFGGVLRAYTNRLRRLGYLSIDSERRTRAELERSEENLRRLFTAVPGPLALTRISDGLVIKANAAAFDYLGVPESDLNGMYVQRFYADPSDRARLIDLVKRDGQVSGFETRLRKESGEIRHALLAVTRVLFEEEECLMVGITDYTEKKSEEERLRHFAATDPLTGLSNRYRFFELSSIEVAHALLYGHQLAVLMVDIDHFKLINDSFGHAAGDEVLRNFAATCRENFRVHDIIARMGGEEFAVVMPLSDVIDAMEAAERLRSGIQDKQVEFRELTIRFTVSIGVGALNPGETSVDTALTRADRALYEAKTQGRNRVVVCAASEPTESGG